MAISIFGTKAPFDLELGHTLYAVQPELSKMKLYFYYFECQITSE